jgi:hypothetical protein
MGVSSRYQAGATQDFLICCPLEDDLRDRSDVDWPDVPPGT